MKKSILLSSILILSLTTFAQSNFQLGLSFSPNIGWLNPDAENVEGEGSAFGFNYGIVADFNIADNYSFSTGITLSNTGGKFSMPDVQQVTSATGTTETGYGNTRVSLR